MPGTRFWTVCLSLLAAVLLGTVAVLATVKSFFGVDWSDEIQLEQLQRYTGSSSLVSLPFNRTAPQQGAGPWTSELDGRTYEHERIPRILHQTWKSDMIPERWASFAEQCQKMHPDYQYMLWTDASSREFIAQHYPWFLATFDGYPYNIQRADVIRYFVLHKYGGVYLDLDIGCRKPMDPLLHFVAVLPVTKPVGVSNDLIFSEPESPFMDSVIHNLIAFDHQYLSQYPTVMFSTGPMFLSAMLSLWNTRGLDRVAVLPKSLYGKNALPQDVPESFFWHYYGSSWHANDSQIFTFLGQFGHIILNIAFVVVLLGALRLVWSYRAAILRTVRGQPIALPEYEALPTRSPSSVGFDSPPPAYKRSSLDFYRSIPDPDAFSLHSVKVDRYL